MSTIHITLSQLLSRDPRYSLLSKQNLPITSTIIPKWQTNWKKKDTVEKIIKVFKELIRSIAVLSIVIPFITLSVDLYQNIKNETCYLNPVQQHLDFNLKDLKKPLLNFSLIVLTNFVISIAYNILRKTISINNLNKHSIPCILSYTFVEVILTPKNPEIKKTNKQEYSL